MLFIGTVENMKQVKIFVADQSALMSRKVLCRISCHLVYLFQNYRHNVNAGYRKIQSEGPSLGY